MQPYITISCSVSLVSRRCEEVFRPPRDLHVADVHSNLLQVLLSPDVDESQHRKAGCYDGNAHEYSPIGHLPGCEC